MVKLYTQREFLEKSSLQIFFLAVYMSSQKKKKKNMIFYFH